MNKVVKIGIKLLIVTVIAFGLSKAVFATLSQAQIASLKNYLIILVPSRGNDSGIFDMRKPMKAGERHQGSGIRDQASGIRYQGSGHGYEIFAKKCRYK